MKTALSILGIFTLVAGCVYVVGWYAVYFFLHGLPF